VHAQPIPDSPNLPPEQQVCTDFPDAKILIVDDFAESIALLQNILTCAGYSHIYSVTDPREAAARYAELRPDVVLLDLNMPHRDGFQVIGELRAVDEAEYVPVIMLTAQVDREVKLKALQVGVRDFLIKPFDRVEVLIRLRNIIEAHRLHHDLHQRNRSLDDLVQERTKELELEVQSRRMAEQHLQYQALHDSLTDLPNRTLFLDRLQQSIYLAERMSLRVAVLLLDLNHFQDVNDTLGHLNGDALLKRVGQRLYDSLRRSDTVARLNVGEQTIARLGGDEFAIVLPGLPALADAMAVVERLQQALRLPFEINGVIFEVGAAIGMVTFPEHGSDATTLMRRADVAMHVAKRTRQDCLLYAPEHDHFSPLRLGLMADLRQAVTGQGLELHYQPKLDLQKQLLVGFEALVRWQHPVHGPIRPDLFIPLAEETGAIKLLTHWVLGTALRQCAALRERGIEAGVAVNLSARDLLDPTLSERVVALLVAQRVPPQALTLEVTESTMMEDPARALAAISQVAEHGVRFSIDDFGTGYSSLAYLKKLPVKEVKLDRSFITDMVRDHKNTMIVRSVIELAHNLELKVVAEGIEDAATGQLLRALGCDEGQGWNIARPMPAADMEPWVRNSAWQPKGR
jgi:diguanylate cyclase (GGDEF)-like protein